MILDDLAQKYARIAKVSGQRQQVDGLRSSKQVTVTELVHPKSTKTLSTNVGYETLERMAQFDNRLQEVLTSRRSTPDSRVNKYCHLPTLVCHTNHQQNHHVKSQQSLLNKQTIPKPNKVEAFLLDETMGDPDVMNKIFCDVIAPRG